MSNFASRLHSNSINRDGSGMRDEMRSVSRRGSALRDKELLGEDVSNLNISLDTSSLKTSFDSKEEEENERKRQEFIANRRMTFKFTLP